MSAKGSPQGSNDRVLTGGLSLAWLLTSMVVGLLILPVPARVSALEADSGTAGTTSVLSRMSLLVQDIEVSKRFYTYALGYEVAMDRMIDNPVVHQQMGLQAGQTLRFVILSSDQVIEGQRREGAGIGLLQVGNPAPPVMSRPDGQVLASGESMMAMRTSDIETVYARLQELGAKIILHPMVSPDGQETELVVHDPDGIRIHVVQRPDRPAPAAN